MPSTNRFLKSLTSPYAREGRHGAAQSAGLHGGEFGSDHCDPHGLFLKQRNAQGSFENILQFILVAKPGSGEGMSTFSMPFLPPQIRMHHVALDRTRPDDRDLDDQVIKLFGRSRGSIDICARLST